MTWTGCASRTYPVGSPGDESGSEVSIAIRHTTAVHEPLHVALFVPGASVGASPVLECTTPCLKRLRAGKYLLAVYRTQNTTEGGDTIVISEPSQIWVEPASKSLRTAGFCMVGGALIAMIVGGGLALSRRECNEGGCSGSDAAMTVGVPMAATGTLVLPFGIVFIAITNNPKIEVEATDVRK